MLKKYALIKGTPAAICGQQVFGYVQVKKEPDGTKLVIALNNFAKATAYAVVGSKVVPINLQASITNFNLPIVCGVDQVIVIMPQLGLYACSSSFQLVATYNTVAEYLVKPEIPKTAQQNDILITSQIQGSQNLHADKGVVKTKVVSPGILEQFCEANCKHIPSLEKIFKQPVLATNFFDNIKPKLAKLFAMGLSEQVLDDAYNGSRWVRLNSKGNPKVVGIVYYLGFPFAIGIGSKNNNGGYNLHFFSAADGSILNIPTLN